MWARSPVVWPGRLRRAGRCEVWPAVCCQRPISRPLPPLAATLAAGGSAVCSVDGGSSRGCSADIRAGGGGGGVTSPLAHQVRRGSMEVIRLGGGATPPQQAQRAAAKIWWPARITVHYGVPAPVVGSHMHAGAPAVMTRHCRRNLTVCASSVGTTPGRRPAKTESPSPSGTG
jgi:hypothetical protein